MYFIDKYSFFVVYSVWVNIKVNKFFNEILINWVFFKFKRYVFDDLDLYY